MDTPSVLTYVSIVAPGHKIFKFYSGKRIPFMKKTMQNLAEELNLSRTTISLVLKGKGDHYRISKKTQERILKKVEKEQFKPNFFAQNLNSRHSMTIGILFPDLFEDFMVKTLRGIGEVLDPLGYTLILMTSHFSRSREKRNIQELLHRGCDGIIIMPVCRFREEKAENTPGVFKHLEKLQKDKFPLILLDRTPPDWRGISVTQNDSHGGALAAEYLLSRGCQKFFLVSLDLNASSIKSRIFAFEKGVGETEKVLLSSQDRNKGDLEEKIKELIGEIRTYPGRVGIFVTTAGLALRVNDLLEKESLSGGRDFHLIRFGCDPEGYKSSLVGIEQPHQEMGRQGAALLVDQLNNRENLISSIIELETVV
jgi:LacI family transcriptional regulator